MKNATIIKNLSEDKILSKNQMMAKINEFSRRELSEEEVYIFSMILCDNNIDRDFERFSENSLEKLKTLFIGKTGIFDHVPKGSNQTSRIFFTDVITDETKSNSLGEPYQFLLAKAYMVKSEKNKDLILEIDAGIKKEISIGCAIKSKTCSICHADHKKNPCYHLPGQYYQKNNQKLLCYLSLENPIDAYEWSFVAVPAQPNAGIIKNFSLSNEEIKYISLTNIDDISKAFSNLGIDNQCQLTSKTISALNEYLIKTMADSKILTDLMDELKSKVYKLLTISQPFLAQSSIEKIVNNLTYRELKELSANLKEDLDIKSVPTQISPLTKDNNQKILDDNSMFKI